MTNERTLLADVLEYLKQQQKIDALIREVMEKGGEVFTESDQPVISMRRRMALIERIEALPAAAAPAPHYHQNCATCTCREPV